MMYRDELQRLEGVWVGTDQVSGADASYAASTRLVFQTVFDGKFLLCDYVQTAPHRPPAVAHGVFRKDDRTNALTVTWFRSPAANSTQQVDAVSADDALVFVETVDGRVTRTTYTVAFDRLSIRTDLARHDDEWERIFEGTYRRR